MLWCGLDAVEDVVIVGLAIRGRASARVDKLIGLLACGVLLIS